MRVRRYRGRHLKRRSHARQAAAATAATVSLAAVPAAHAAIHTVGRGDTLSHLAARYHVSVAWLAHANHLSDPNLIVIGERLRIPGTGGRRSGGSTHTVAPGETLSGIAAHTGTTVAALAAANHLRDPNLIVVGQHLKIPAHSAAVSVSGSPSVGSILESQAVAHGVQPELVKAVAWHESGWRQSARSSVGAIGIMQVMPGTARYVNHYLGGGHLDVRHASGNVELGTIYLHHMLDTLRTERRALAGYYSGPGAVHRHLDEGQRHYASAVEHLKARF